MKFHRCTECCKYHYPVIKIMLISLALGILLGFLLDSDVEPKQVSYEGAVAYLEKELIDFPGIWGTSSVSELATLQQLKGVYFEMKPLSSSIMARKVKDICMRKDWSSFEIPTIDSIARDDCLSFCGGYFNGTG